MGQDGIFCVILLVATVLWLAWKTKRRGAHIVNLTENIPGPLSLPIVGSAFMFLNKSPTEIFKMLDIMTRKYWPIFKTYEGSKIEIHLSEAEHVEKILHSTAHINKSSFYEFLHPWIGNGLITATGSRWHAFRKLLTPTFHFKILENFQEVFVEKSEILINKLKMELGNKGGFDLVPYITLCALDIICETAMGTPIHAQDNASSDYVSAIYEITELLFLRMMKPWLFPNFIYWRSPSGRKFKKCLNTLHQFTNKVVEEKRQEMSNQKQKTHIVAGKRRRLAFLDMLLEASQGGVPLSDEEIREEVDTFMFAGHDTTSANMEWLLFLLGSYEDVQEKVWQELDEIFQGSDRPATVQDLQQMKYLEMVIKETLRLYPSVPFIGRHATEDIDINDYVIPQGSDINVHIYHVHRNPKYFPDPDEFNPDHFLPDNIQGRHPFAFVPFSAGPRNCIGQKFAIMEVKTVVSSIIRRYRVKSCDKLEDVRIASKLVLRNESGFRVTLEERTAHE